MGKKERRYLNSIYNCIFYYLFISLYTHLGNNTRIEIHHGMMEEYGAEIPTPFEKIGSNFYYINDVDNANWFGAVEQCRKVNGHLVNLQNETDISNISSRLNKSFVYWTDLNNLVHKKKFLSLTTGKDGNFFNEELETNETNQCVFLKWNEPNQMFVLSKQNCFDKFAFPICQTTQASTINIVFW